MEFMVNVSFSMVVVKVIYMREKNMLSWQGDWSFHVVDFNLTVWRENAINTYDFSTAISLFLSISRLTGRRSFSQPIFKHFDYLIKYVHKSITILDEIHLNLMRGQEKTKPILYRKTHYSVL